MAVAFDNLTESAAFTADTTFNHTPVGTPRGVLVFVGQNGGATLEVDSVTYGGQALTYVGGTADTSVELMRSDVWFLGSGIPTGTQTVAVNETGGTSKVAYCVTLTAAADTAVEGFATAEQNQANPSATITTGASVETYVAALFMSGLGVVGDIAAGTGFTLLDQNDLGQQTMHLADIDANDAGGNVTAAFTSASDDVALVAVAVKESAAAPVLSADPGSFGVTGVAATVVAARVLSADPGSFAVTGADATLGFGRFVSVDPGSFAVTGTDVTVLADRTLDCQPGSFTVTGTDATTAAGRVFSVDPGHIAVNETGGYYLQEDGTSRFTLEDGSGFLGSEGGAGAEASLLAGRALLADPGAHTVTGVDAALVHTTTGAYTLDVDPGAFTVTGADATLAAGRVFNAEPAAYTITGTDAELVHQTAGAYTVNAEPGVYAVTGANATTVATRELSADPGTYTTTGADATVVAARVLSSDPGAYTVTGNDTTLSAERLLDAQPGSFTVTGVAASLGTLFDSEVDAQPGTFVVSGNAAALEWVPGLARNTTRGGRIRWNSTGGFRGENRAGRITQTYEGAVS